MFGDAESYERFMGRWSYLLAPLLVNFADGPEPGRLLDVGSGTGSLAFWIAKQSAGCHVLGIDSSKEYVEYASRRNPFPDRVCFQIGDAQQLGFPDATFQSSISLLVFNFLTDPKKALGEVRRVTKPGGRIAAAVWDYGSEMQMLRAFWDAAASVDITAEELDEKHMPLCRGSELAELWRQGGLQNVEERPLEITMRFESFADYWDPFLFGQGPAGTYVRRLDSDRLEALRGALKRRLGLTRNDTAFSLSAGVRAVRGAVPTP